MSTERKTLNAFMCSLVDECGGVVGAASCISARWNGSVSPGTISRKKSGDLDWTVCDVIALQEAVGRHSVFDWFETLREDRVVKADAMAAAARSSVEQGEAMAALLSAKTPSDRARAIKEWRDVVESAEVVVDALEAEA